MPPPAARTRSLPRGACWRTITSSSLASHTRAPCLSRGVPDGRIGISYRVRRRVGSCPRSSSCGGGVLEGLRDAGSDRDYLAIFPICQDCNVGYSDASSVESGLIRESPGIGESRDPPPDRGSQTCVPARIRKARVATGASRMRRRASGSRRRVRRPGYPPAPARCETAGGSAHAIARSARTRRCARRRILPR